jgi:hypothetical protein
MKRIKINWKPFKRTMIILLIGVVVALIAVGIAIGKLI